MPKKERESSDTTFKNGINADLVLRIGLHIQQQHPEFDLKSFVSLSPNLKNLELKPRVRLIRDHLKEQLPENYNKALAILLKAVLKPKPNVKALHGFDLWPVTEFIQLHGIKDFEKSLQALYALTPLFTAEFALRPFLIQEPKKTLKVLHIWAKDRDHHVRRLVSEGSRPRLPWGEQIKAFIEDPTLTIELLEKLKYDEELYVRKSVANHLNDISKDHPELAVKIATQWKKQAPKKHEQKINWIIKHALRTQLKKGHQGALKLLGYEAKGKIQIKKLELKNKQIKFGESLEFSFILISDAGGTAMIDYIIHHQKANGETKPKVFKLTEKILAPNSPIILTKKHSFKPITTRVYYPGLHHLEIMINGQKLKKIPFTLTK